MTTMTKLTRVALTLALVTSVAACDELLEVELPGQATEEGTFVASQATLLVNSAIADIECAYSDFTAFEAAGYEDTSSRTVGWWGGRFERPITPGTGGNCAGTQENQSGNWFKPLHKGRWMAEQVYDRLENEWDATAVPNRERLMAMSAIYAGIAYTFFGEFFCEAAFDAGDLRTWSQTLQDAEAWFTTALGHIATSGDFAIPTGVTTSARQMAYMLRARARFAQNTPATDALAVQDAQQVTGGTSPTTGSVAWVTRDAGAERSRFNRVYSGHVGLGWVALLGPVDWWSGAPDPVSGNPWPAVIPYTGYWDLAIQADGRAVSDAGDAVTLANTPTATKDTRVPVESVAPGGIGTVTYPRWEQRKYANAGSDFALAKWQEARLIEGFVTGGATAINMVNTIRAATVPPLPAISGAYLTTLTDGTNDAADIRNMLLEEARRVYFLEGGRWWSHKLRYNLWFPRGQDVDNWNFTYQTGVRMVFPDAEFDLNTHLDPNMQGASCPPFQDPTT